MPTYSHMLLDALIDDFNNDIRVSTDHSYLIASLSAHSFVSEPARCRAEKWLRMFVPT